jgi:N-acetylmuramoyl-L-alanine amidase
VIYTRKSDIFVTLGRRAEIANKASADLFVSIHTNALPKKKIGRGAETYTLGMARADDNLEVAKRENAVILVENDYQERYQGFDPNSSESYIIFEFMQDKNMENSVNFAKNIQKEFKSTGGRIDKGVHQAGFLVLRETSMPSVLVELGYISTPDEEKFLSSKNGINKMSRSLYNAFCQYRKGHSKTTITITENTIPQPPQPLKETVKAETKKDNPSPVFKVQLMASSQQLKSNNPRFKGLKPIDFYKEKGLYKYTYGATNDYQEAVKLKNTAKKYFKEAFIIAFKNGVKTDVQKAINETKKNKK